MPSSRWFRDKLRPPVFEQLCAVSMDINSRDLRQPMALVRSGVAPDLTSGLWAILGLRGALASLEDAYGIVVFPHAPDWCGGAAHFGVLLRSPGGTHAHIRSELGALAFCSSPSRR